MKTIYQNDGSKSDPENYRGITLVSCLSKLFTGVINKRLSEYLENNNLLNENQTRFRKTTLHLIIFSTYTQLSNYALQRERNYTVLSWTMLRPLILYGVKHFGLN